jgi:toxin HigB-1
VIGSFRDKALERLWVRNDPRGIRPDQRKRVLRMLGVLDEAISLDDLKVPGFRFHALHGLPPRYSLTVTGNWRITFEWDGDDAVRVDYEDDH